MFGLLPSLSYIFLTRAQEEDGVAEMDYRLFLDFAFAFESVDTSIAYFWKILDIDGKVSAVAPPST